MEEELEEYILSHISPEPEFLRVLARRTALSCLYSRMCSGHLQGRMLKMFTQMIRPRRILELGAYTGYSTLCFAEGSPEGTTITTVEIDDEREDSLRETFAASGYGNRIDLLIGDALEIIPTLSGEFDLVFIDANKRNYADYLRLVLPLVSDGGYIIADNTLWDGKVAAAGGSADPQTKGIREFNDLAASLDCLEVTIIPLRDGLTVLRHSKK